MSESIQTMIEEDTLEINEIHMEDEDSNVQEPSILRTSFDGCFEVYQGPWGKYIRSCSDPNANVEITKEHLEHFELNSNIHRIPADLWSRWIKLCFHFVNKISDEVEVSVRILRSEEDASKYRILVPKQKVSSAAVRIDSFDESIDIETGEVVESYPPTGWIPVGSSHSHNTMPAFFSGTDDKYELGDPGIHIVVGGIDVEKNTYTLCSSVVGSGRRFTVHFQNLIDATPISGATFHEDVLGYVDYTTPVYTYAPVRVSNKKAYRNSSNSHQKDSSNYQQWLEKYTGYKYSNKEYDEYMQGGVNDPFFYDDNGYYGENVGGERNIRLWEIEDLINDYIKQNSEDLNKMFILYDLLKGVEEDIDSSLCCSES